MIDAKLISSEVERLFGSIEFTGEPAGLYDPLRYMISIGGKRLRPMLCLTSYSLFRDRFEPAVLDCAAALEVFHTFTLIHDDIMDRSPLRRGVATVWKKWNEDTAILSGDVMLIDAYTRIAKAPEHCHKQALELFSRTAAQVCEGQQYDMEFESMDDVPMSSYIDMIGLKTAVLIACSAKMGALVAGASEQECDALYDYGYQLGLAFQIADDYLDAYGDEKVFGKPIGGDIINCKKSWLTVRALEKCSSRSAFMDAFNRPASTDGERAAKIACIKSMYDALGVAADARAEIERLSEEALGAASSLGPAIPVLKEFAGKLIGRAR
ncbi:MAG: polyprenyl synthetase family protein [Bacteroidales bacterium]|nr:polyprenyl synthetase family protein [Bacteroidales bacterium]